MTNLLLLVGLSLLTSAGVRFLWNRQWLQKLIGLSLLSHALNLFLLLSGVTPPQSESTGGPAFVGNARFEFLADPLPQALILTAIVISFGTTAFLAFLYLVEERPKL